jgi:membrane protein DedA with SNARE-associated domain
LGLSIAYLAGAATLTPVVAVFLAAAVVGTLVGYGVGNFYEKVSSKLSDVSTKQPGLLLQA